MTPLNADNARMLREASPAQRVELGARVRHLRLDKGVTQVGLGDAIGHTISMVSRLEAGKRNLTPEHLNAIGEFLDFDPNAFFIEGLLNTLPTSSLSNSGFRVGDRVRREKGSYLFPSTVQGIAYNRAGEERLVCESLEIPGLLHIMSPSQMVPNPELVDH